MSFFTPFNFKINLNFQNIPHSLTSSFLPLNPSSLMICDFLMRVTCSSSNKDPGARPVDALSLRDHEGGIPLILVYVVDNGLYFC